MKVSIMMAARNAAPYIADAIGSLLRQRDAAALDIVVVNDGSTDGTGDLVRSLALADVRLIDQPPRGVTPTRNVALSAIAPDADFVTVLDADDLMPLGRLARDLRLLDQDPSLGLVFGDSLLFRTTALDPLEPDFSAPTLRIRGVQMGAGLYRRDLIRRTGIYDETLEQGEDLDFMLRMLELNPRFQLVDAVSYYYRRHQTNITRDGSTLRRGVARAMLLAAKRKSAGGLPPFPKGFFDLSNLALSPEWQ